MSNLVLDSSVIIKWFRKEGEENREKALKIRDKFLAGELKIVVPDLFYYEITNVLKTKSRASLSSIARVIELLFIYPLITVHPSTEFLQEANRIAFQFKLTVYDALYLAVAKHLDCPLITADQKLMAKTAKSARIKLLKDY